MLQDTSVAGCSTICCAPGQHEALRYAVRSQLPDGFRCVRLPRCPHNTLQAAQVVSEPLPDLP